MDREALASTRGVLVLSQVADACVRLVGAGLLIRSFLGVLDVKLGFWPEQTAVWRINSGPLTLYDRMVRRLEAMPGVDSAGVTEALPLSRDRSWGIRDRSWGIRGRGITYAPSQMLIAHPLMPGAICLRATQEKASQWPAITQTGSSSVEVVVRTRLPPDSLAPRCL